MELTINNNYFLKNNLSTKKSLVSKKFNDVLSKVSEKTDSNKNNTNDKELITGQFIKGQNGLVSEVYVNGIKMSVADALLLRGDELKRNIEEKYSKEEIEILEKAFDLS